MSIQLENQGNGTYILFNGIDGASCTITKNQYYYFKKNGITTDYKYKLLEKNGAYDKDGQVVQ